MRYHLSCRRIWARSPAARAAARTRSARAASLLALLFTLFSALLFAGTAPALASDAYFRGDALALSDPDWMAGLSDDLLLSQLSLPGTHDTMARQVDAWGACQDVTLANQLQAGVRALDIRCKNDFSSTDGHYFSLWHGFLYRLGTFDQVADACKAFLTAHPRETIVMRIREENLPDPKTTQSFSATFASYRDSKYRGLFAEVGDGRTIPRLGQVRGQVVVLQDYDYTPFWGLRYITPGSHPPFDSQDNAVVAPSAVGFAEKWDAITGQLYRTNAGDRAATWYVNYVSGGTRTEPYRVAGGSTDGFSAAGMDDRLLALLRAGGPLAPPSGIPGAAVPLVSAGTVFMDFPGPGLIQAVIALNPGAAPAFTDVSGTPYEAAIYELAGNGAILGFDDHTFRPNAPVTRQQFAKMIVKTLGIVPTGSEVCPFTDVPAQVGSDLFYPSKYVAICARRGITKGTTATTFDPASGITHQQLMSMVVRAADVPAAPETYLPGFTPAQFDPYEHYLNARSAGYAGLLEGVVGVGPEYDFFAPSTRGECAQMLSRLLRILPAS